jgi:hypothetical protein
MSTQDEQIQRLHYFDNQFLKAEDFTTEQEYHLEMRRRHNRLLHTKGVAKGLEIIKTSNKKITVKAGVAIDGNGSEIILLKELLISLEDTTKYPNNSTVYVFASYAEQKQKPQPDNSTDQNQTTRFFENAVIKAETNSPDTNDKQIVRLGRFQLSPDGNVDESKFSNIGFREEAAAKIPEFSVSIQQLKNTLVTEGTKDILAGKEFSVGTLGISVTSPKPGKSVFLLVYAHSTTDGSQFNWRQQYKTEKLTTDSELMIRQYVVFQNELTNKTINLQYKIYALEG